MADDLRTQDEGSFSAEQLPGAELFKLVSLPAIPGKLERIGTIAEAVVDDVQRTVGSLRYRGFVVETGAPRHGSRGRHLC